MNDYPKVDQSKKAVNIIFVAYEGEITYVDIEFVVDFNQYGEIVGVEILNIKLESGEKCLDIIESAITTLDNALRYSYDEESDSFYLEISEERSIHQKSINGLLVINQIGQIVGLKFDLND